MTDKVRTPTLLVTASGRHAPRQTDTAYDEGTTSLLAASFSKPLTSSYWCARSSRGHHEHVQFAPRSVLLSGGKSWTRQQIGASSVNHATLPKPANRGI
ncbi:hypothetical protein BaRGS_00012035 [Batillaria attramentaria]|uniref:Uncharacterized protein n=1 Tax=Batillaria attramentaria TaxID=370345 RepID=A0ABD0LB73_9CAEN